MRALALEKKQRLNRTAHQATAWQQAGDSSTREPSTSRRIGPPGRATLGSLYSPAMWRFLRRVIKWTLIIAAVAAAVRWIKNKREGDEAEPDPGSIEPWPPLEGDVPAGDDAEETATA